MGCAGLFPFPPANTACRPACQAMLSTAVRLSLWPDLLLALPALSPYPLPVAPTLFHRPMPSSSPATSSSGPAATAHLVTTSKATGSRATLATRRRHPSSPRHQAQRVAMLVLGPAAATLSPKLRSSLPPTARSSLHGRQRQTGLQRQLLAAAAGLRRRTRSTRPSRHSSRHSTRSRRTLQIHTMLCRPLQPSLA